MDGDLHHETGLSGKEYNFFLEVRFRIMVAGNE
jgi:hypothetical protein